MLIRVANNISKFPSRMLLAVFINLRDEQANGKRPPWCSTDSFKRSLKTFLFQSVYGCETRVS